MRRRRSWRPAVRTAGSSSGASTSATSNSPGASYPCFRCSSPLNRHPPVPLTLPFHSKFPVMHTCNLMGLPQGHAGHPVTSVQLYSLPGGGSLLVSTGGDTETRVWEGPSAGKAGGAAAAWRLRQTLSIDGKLQLSAALTALDVDSKWCGPSMSPCPADCFQAWVTLATWSARDTYPHAQPCITPAV